jgi:KDO2-lipid IV(A) lauroyltransferase
MKRKRSRTANFVQYIGLKTLVAFIRLIPLHIGVLVLKSLAYVFYLFDKKQRKIAYENLCTAYGDELSDIQIRKIIRSTYVHFALVWIDFVKLPQIVNTSNWQNYFEVEGLEFAQKAREQGKGVIFVTGHVGNWEVLGYAFEFFFHPLHSIAKHLKNPFADRYLTRLREKGRQKIIFTENASRKIIRVLRDNKPLGILVDQNARENNIFVDFFGRKAATTRSVATIALKTGSPIIMCFLRRTDSKYRFRITLSEPVQVERSGNLEKDISNLTQKYTALIESRIREHPHEWLWMHRRWKTKPPIATAP